MGGGDGGGGGAGDETASNQDSRSGWDLLWLEGLEKSTLAICGLDRFGESTRQC